MVGNIVNVYISNFDFAPMTSQSCDCSALVIDLGYKLILVEHDKYKDLGCIRYKEIAGFDKSIFSICVVLNEDLFSFDKVLYHDNGVIDAIRYRSKDTFMFIFASEYELILTKSKYDLFEDGKMEFPEKEAILEYKRVGIL